MRGKKLFSCGVFLLMIGISFSSVSFVQSSTPRFEKIIQTYSFTAPSFQKVTIEGCLYDQVTIKEAPCGGITGEPCLPSMGMYLMIPQGRAVSEIIVTPGKKISLGSQHHIEPVSAPIPFSQTTPKTSFVQDQDIYDSSTPYPPERFTYVGTYLFRGYQILVVRLHPMEYIPLTGELSYYTELTVSVNLKQETKQNPMFQGTPEDELEVINKVDNPEVVNSYRRQTMSPLAEQYDLLILTTNALKTDFQRLAQFHNARGTKTIIKTMEDIGNLNPEAIRGYIKEAFINWGIRYVLLGGDNDVVPACNLYATDGLFYMSIAADLYYSCLDGPFNYDGDQYWGEPHDGEGGGDVDLIADIAIGRACVGDSNEVDIFVDKTIAYLSTQDLYLDKALMVGEYLGFGGIAEYGGNYMDQLINGSDDDGYSTKGIPATIYNVSRLYDRDWPGQDWPKTELMNRISSNIHIINHLGHGNTYHVMKLDEPVIMRGGQIQGECHDVEQLENTQFFFVYSQACYSGSFDNKDAPPPYGSGDILPYDCIAEYLTTKTTHGAFAAIMNARFGFGMSHSTDAPSQRYHREFIDAIFGENITELSRANQDSKEDNLYRINDQCMRWCYYQLNLFGDPTIGFPSSLEITSVEATYGGLGNGGVTSATIKNTGAIHLTQVQWNISVTGGFLRLIRVSNQGIIETLNPNETTLIKTTIPIIGFGPVVIKIGTDALQARATQKNVQGFIIGPFLTIQSEE